MVRAIPAPGAGGNPRSFFDKMNEWAREQGAGGLGYITFAKGEAPGPDRQEPGGRPRRRDPRGLRPRPTATRCSSPPARRTRPRSSPARRAPRLGNELGLIEKDAYRFCWVTDFPMYELNEETGQIDFSHNPFSMPQGGLEALNTRTR